ncbi:MAG: pyrroline-5-carboxylate reductase [Treponema sp.]|jgi:pyrroline-5-carboxylate reductase|nr:pyrroline-5-carboxylate reductase [Treponema sp.]
MNITIACIGSGNMGNALMKGASGITGPEHIAFTDAEGARAEASAKALGARALSSNTEAAGQGDYVFLAVKPQVLARVLREIAPVIRKRLAEAGTAPEGAKVPVLVSMAAGWSIQKIQALLVKEEGEASGPGCPVVRIMPNTPALVSRGLIALSPSPEVPAERTAELERILGSAGLVDRVEEQYLDAVTGLSGSGPAFVYLFIEALADGGVLAGLPRDKALRYAAQTVLGSAAMVQETGIHPGELKDMVCSPGGTTIAGVAALENGAFRASVIKAVEAAWRRSAELGKP